MKSKSIYAKIILVILVVVFATLACENGNGPEPDNDEPVVEEPMEEEPAEEPAGDCGAIDLYGECPAWLEQNCMATVFVAQNLVSMDYQNQLEELDFEHEYLVIEGSQIIVSDPGIAEIDYGGGQKMIIYAPQGDQTELNIEQLNGIIKVAMNAAAGEVIEDSDSTSCELTVVAVTPDGIVEITSQGTRYLVVVSPELDKEQVEIAIDSGAVNVRAPDGEGTFSPQEDKLAVVSITDGVLGDVVMLSVDLQDLLYNYQSGRDLLEMNFDRLQLLEPPQYDATLTLWHPWTNPDQIDALGKITEAFQADYPGVEIEIASPGGYNELQEKFSVSLMAGGSPLLLIGSPEWIPAFYDQKVLLPLSMGPHEAVLKRLSPPALGSVLYDGGRLMGVPINMTGVVMYRNKNIIPTAPSTYEEMRAWAQEVNDGYRIGIALPYQTFVSGGLLYGLGGRLIDEDGFPAFYDEKGFRWLEQILDFTEFGWVGSYGDSYGKDQFYEYNAGFIIDGSWARNEFVEYLGYEDLAVDPWPASMSGLVWTDNLYLNFQAAADENTQLAAREFMAFMLSDTAQQIMAETGMVPSVMNLRVRDPILQQVMAALAGGTPRPIVSALELYWHIESPLNSAIHNVLNGELTPEEALARAEEEIYAEIENYR